MFNPAGEHFRKKSGLSYQFVFFSHETTTNPSLSSATNSSGYAAFDFSSFFFLFLPQHDESMSVVRNGEVRIVPLLPSSWREVYCRLMYQSMFFLTTQRMRVCYPQKRVEGTVFAENRSGWYEVWLDLSGRVSSCNATNPCLFSAEKESRIPFLPRIAAQVTVLFTHQSWPGLGRMPSSSLVFFAWLWRCVRFWLCPRTPLDAERALWPCP